VNIFNPNRETTICTFSYISTLTTDRVIILLLFGASHNINYFHATHEISRLENLILLLENFSFDISGNELHFHFRKF
jgi:hypothetical protein